MSSLLRRFIVASIAVVGVGVVAVNQNEKAANFAHSVVDSAKGLVTYPDKLGWMDDKELMPSDRLRIAEISRQGLGSNLGTIRAAQSGYKSEITRNDFELLRQDRRRAQAAYPNISQDKLLQGIWLSVDLNAEIPESFCPSGNSEGTEKNGKWYLDGGCYTSIVNPQYLNRADTKTTKDYFVTLKNAQRAERLEELNKEGPFAWEGGTGGSLTVGLDKKTNEVVIVHAEEWANKAQEWRMPFIPDQWVDVNPYDLESIKKMPSFVTASKKEVPVEPSGIRIEIVQDNGPSVGRPIHGTYGKPVREQRLDRQ